MKMVLDIDTEDMESIYEAYSAISGIVKMHRVVPEENKVMLEKVEKIFDTQSEEEIRKMLTDISVEVADFFENTKLETLRRLLIRKMTEGAKEHGNPPKDVDLIQAERRQEMIDLIGWTLVEKNAKGEL